MLGVYNIFFPSVIPETTSPKSSALDICWHCLFILWTISAMLQVSAMYSKRIKREIKSNKENHTQLENRSVSRTWSRYALNVFDWPNSELCQSAIPTAVGFSKLIIEGQVDKLIVHLLIFTFYYVIVNFRILSVPCF